MASPAQSCTQCVHDARVGEDLGVALAKAASIFGGERRRHGVHKLLPVRSTRVLDHLGAQASTDLRRGTPRLQVLDFHTPG